MSLRKNERCPSHNSCRWEQLWRQRKFASPVREGVNQIRACRFWQGIPEPTSQETRVPLPIRFRLTLPKSRTGLSGGTAVVGSVVPTLSRKIRSKCALEPIVFSPRRKALQPLCQPIRFLSHLY